MVKSAVKLCIGLNQLKNKQEQKVEEKKVKAQMPEHVPVENMIILVGGRCLELQEEIKNEDD